MTYGISSNIMQVEVMHMRALSAVSQNKKRDREKRLRLVAEKMDLWRKRHAKIFKGFNSTEVLRKMRNGRYGKESDHTGCRIGDQDG